MRIGILLVCLGLTGCYKVYRAYGDGLREGDSTFFTLEDCEDFVKKAAEIQPDIKRLCARVAD